MNTRDEVAANLERWCAPGRPLSVDGPNASDRLFSKNSRRRQVVADIGARYLDRQYDVGHDMSCAVVTAGPPGAGKSTAVATLGGGYRVIDPDAIKDMLLLQAKDDGTYDRLLDLRLADGQTLCLRELAGLVHAESTMIANDILRVALTRGENIVIEGTLRHWPHATYMLGMLDEFRYSQLRILSCDLPEAVAQERALDRWWTDRVTNADGLGGRIVPTRVIADLYTKTVDRSDCSYNADDFFSLAVGTIPEVYLRQQDLSGMTEKRSRRI